MSNFIGINKHQGNKVKLWDNVHFWELTVNPLVGKIACDKLT